MKTIFDIEITNEDLQNVNYKYQLELTSKLDGLDDDLTKKLLMKLFFGK